MRFRINAAAIGDKHRSAVVTRRGEDGTETEKYMPPQHQASYTFDAVLRKDRRRAQSIFTTILPM